MVYKHDLAVHPGQLPTASSSANAEDFVAENWARAAGMLAYSHFGAQSSGMGMKAVRSPEGPAGARQPSISTAVVLAPHSSTATRSSFAGR